MVVEAEGCWVRLDGPVWTTSVALMVKSRCVAQAVACDIRDDVHAGVPGLTVVRIILSFAAVRGLVFAFFGIVAGFLQIHMDDFVAHHVRKKRFRCFLFF